MKSRVHEVLVKIRFDAPISRGRAVAEIRDNIHGTFYPTQWEDNDPGEFKISSIRSAKRSDPR